MLTKRQEAELVTAIQGRGEVPLKFAYLGEGAKNWDSIAKERVSTSGGINSIEANLLKKRMDDFISTLDKGKSVNLVDIGCGNGLPVVPILQRLQEKNIPFTYVPMDISGEMIDLALNTVRSKFSDVVCKPFQMDFELGQFSDLMYEIKKDGSVNLMVFLGSTLGNHSDLSRVLTNFRDSMTSKDYLIVGVELTNIAKVNKIIPHYENSAAKALVSHTLSYLNISDKSFGYEVLWNDKNSQIEMRAVFNKDVKAEIAGYSFVIEKDESILLAKSIKFTEYAITKLFSDVGLRTELLTTSEDRGYVLTMVQPTRYSI
ncbi:MAG: L-histidine N(alpha)-methyltransferase [Candidatus Paceibacterota bacterium]